MKKTPDYLEKIMCRYFGVFSNKVRVYSVEGALDAQKKMNIVSVLLLEYHVEHLMTDDEDKERAARSIAQLEENLPIGWRYGHLLGPAV